LNSGISLYTNNGRFQVRFYNQNGEVAKVNVYDALGQKGYSQRVTTALAHTRIDVNLSNAANGICTVELLDGSDMRAGAKQVFVNH
jgi:UDP-galactopyranose mutase